MRINAGWSAQRGYVKKYIFHYGGLPIYWTYARSIRHVLAQIEAWGMDVPDCIEDCHAEIWWREDHE
jgi:hypothetical protein